jgi:hypothetical protein
MDQFNSQGYQPAPQFGQSKNQFPPFTNIILVDSLEQALRMPARTHSEMVYWNRYLDEIYRIYTDYSNGKQYMVLDVKLQTVPKKEKSDTEQHQTKQDLSMIMDTLTKMQQNLEVLNEKYNVNANVGANAANATEQAAK